MIKSRRMRWVGHKEFGNYEVIVGKRRAKRPFGRQWSVRFITIKNGSWRVECDFVD
jgi:hypothetical protein